MSNVKVSREEQKKQILKVISGSVDLPAVPRKYVFGLLITACAILLLPLFYLAVMALLLERFYIFVRNGHLVIAGVTSLLILGLIKPFLARSSAVKRPRKLRRDAESFLYDYVDRLCDSIGACRPTAIHISCDLNAAAEFRKGWLSFFSNQGISLHLGLPMAAGLTLRQFTGVLAHELGHFTQRTAMWLENMVRRTNLWLIQAAMERDSIDDWLARRCAIGGPLAIPCYFACAIVWVTRWLLLGLARAGTIISCMMSREMEFNADRCEVRAVGTRTFASTLWRMRELSVAHQISFRDVAAFYDEGRLPDNMIALATANTAFITPKVKKTLQRMMTEEKTGLFDSHPADRDRIQAAEADGSSGFFQFGSLPNNLPASVLFSRFDEISKVVTTQFYENLLNREIKSQLLHPVDKLLERQNVRIEAARSLRRYFQTEIPPLRPLPIASQSTEPPESPRETIEELISCRERMIAELPAYQRLLPRYRRAEETLFETIGAQSLVQARLPFKPSLYHLKEASSETIAEKHSRAREGVANLAGKLLPFETEAGNRLSFAMQLMHLQDVLQKIPNGDELQTEIEEILPEAQFVSHLIGELPTLRITFYRLLTLSERVEIRQKKHSGLQMIVGQMELLRNRLISIQKEMGDRLYPFEHANAKTTLQQYVLPQIPGAMDLDGLVEATDHMQSRLVTIQMRLFARLAQAAEKIEHVIGLAPLPEPENALDLQNS